MMNSKVSSAILLVCVCISMWAFADTIIWSQEKTMLVEQQALEKVILTIGTTEGCKVDVHLSVWEDLNQLMIYRWVVACEDMRK